MNFYKLTCSLHPKVTLRGVCHLCLNERLVVLALKQSQRTSDKSQNKGHRFRSQSLKQYNKRSQVKISNTMYALRNSIVTRFDSLRRSSHSYSEDNGASDITTPDQDSFISIKFEDNGVASWDKGVSVSKVSLDHCNISWNNKMAKLETTTHDDREGGMVIKHLETQRGGSVRWRKRIGHMFQLIRWKKSSTKVSGGCPSNVKTTNIGANGWIRTLTKRRTKNK